MLPRKDGDVWLDILQSNAETELKVSSGLLICHWRSMSIVKKLGLCPIDACWVGGAEHCGNRVEVCRHGHGLFQKINATTQRNIVAKLSLLELVTG